MNTFFVIDEFTDAHKWTPQLLEKLPPYKFQAEFHAPDGRLTLRCIRNAPKFHFSLFSLLVTYGQSQQTAWPKK